jgi:hypothetical protein
MRFVMLMLSEGGRDRQNERGDARCSEQGHFH